MNPSTIHALVLRYIYLYSRTPMRLIELVFWPVVDLMVWGTLTLYLQKNMGDHMLIPLVALIAGWVLWDVLFRAQQGVAISFLEDVWTRNLLNIFVAPVRVTEYVLATFTIGFLRICITMVVLCVLAAIGYNFNIFSIQWALIPFFVNLLVFGWSLGMISTALILRWGQAVESLAWAVPFFIQPLVSVAYPVDTLPQWLIPLANCFPATHVFEGMRAVLSPLQHAFPWHHIAWASVLNVVFLALAGTIFGKSLLQTKKRGLLTKFATQ